METNSTLAATVERSLYATTLRDVRRLLIRSEKVDVEREYPWLVRYTEDIRGDAPSQLPLYYQHTKALTHRPVTKAEMLAAHRKFTPYYPELTLDLEPTVELIDRGTWDNDRQYEESSGQRTSNEYSSEQNDIQQELDNQFMRYDNPVVKQPATLTPVMSDVHISGLQQRRTPLKVTDLTTSKVEEKAQLLKRLKELDEEEVPKTKVSFSQPVEIIPSINRAPKIVSYNNLPTPLNNIWTNTAPSATSYQSLHQSRSFMAPKPIVGIGC